MWWHHDLGWDAWLGTGLMMAGMWVLLALLVWLLLRAAPRLGRREDARDVLGGRLARGEIGPDEYRARMEALDELD